MKSPAVDLIKTLNVDCSTGTWDVKTNTLTSTRKILDTNTLNASEIDVTIGQNQTLVYRENGHYRIVGFSGAQAITTFKIQGGAKDGDSSFTVTTLNATLSGFRIGLVYSLEFDISGIELGKIPAVENITLVVGKAGYSYEQIYGPIATIQDMFDACGIMSQPETPDGSKAIIFDLANSHQKKKSEDVQSSGWIFRFFLTDNPSQEYQDNQAIRFSDLQTSSYSESSL